MHTFSGSTSMNEKILAGWATSDILRNTVYSGRSTWPIESVPPT
jgi:hypothetical protein